MSPMHFEYIDSIIVRRENIQTPEKQMIRQCEAKVCTVPHIYTATLAILNFL